jgi:hypothetical protein
MLTTDEKSQIEKQVALSKGLGLGVALSLLPVAGIGSLAAIIIGARAKKKIKESGGQLAGGWMASWCVVVGTVGLIANVFLFWRLVIRR